MTMTYFTAQTDSPRRGWRAGFRSSGRLGRLAVGLAVLSGWPAVAVGGLGEITGLSVEGNRLAVVCGSDELDVQVCSRRMLRLSYRPGGNGDARTAMIGTTNWTYAGAVIETNSDPIVITTPAMRVEIARSPCRVSVADAEGNPVVWELEAEGLFADGIRLGHNAGTEFYGIHGYNAWDDSSAGLLRSAGGWAEAGYQGDCGAPFIWNRNGFGLLVDSDGIQFNASDSTLTAEYCSRTEVEVYLMLGSPEEILSDAAQVSGRPPLFPKWGMGFANTEWGITQSELTNIVNGYRTREIPIDLYVLDFDWKDWGADHYGEWNWNPAKFPGGASGELKAQMDAAGIRMGGIMKPRIHVYTEQGGYASSNGFWWPGQAEYSDYFSEQPVKDVNFAVAACREWFFDHITNAFDTGMTAWWNDEADQAGGGSMLFDNWQFMNMQKALYEGQRGHADRRVWSINRNFWPGAQRYAYAMWSGDIDGGFASMAAQRERMLSAVNLGAARWGMDIGGFNNAGQTTAECYARWMQFGAVAPVFRVHGQQDQQRQPWVYGAQAEAVAAAAIRLRYRLMPYLYSYERRLHETGVGIVRPLALAFPDDPATANIRESWMFGEHLLASPVVQEGQSQKNLYLPAGTWRDFFRGTEYAGGQTHAVPVDSATWEDLPLFVREGAILPLQPVMNYVGEAPVTNLDLLMLPSTARTSFVYYDDDGETYGYETGAYHRQEIALQDTGESIEADFSVPEGSWTPPTEFFYAWVRCPTNHGARLDGTELAQAADETALRASASPGWTHATNQFGYAALVKVPAGAAQNLVLSNHLAAVPRFSPGAGTYSGLVVVEMSCATAGAEIRYTLDGSDPGEASTLYQAPVPLAASAELRARAYAEGREPSTVATASYVVETGRLNNPGFEWQAGTNTEAALYWETGQPDGHGERWGTAARVAWRPRSGSWHGTVRGSWLGIGETSGGFWQETEALPGQTYTLGAWFWADHTWSAGRQGFKLEFLDGAGGGETVVLALTNSTADVGESWVWKEISATAPSNAAWVRAVVFADSVGADGALQFDDMSLEGPAQHVFSVASAHGTPVPAAGHHVVNSGAVVTGSVDSPVSGELEEYVCTGWTLEGNEPASGSTNRVEVTVTNTARLTWLWTTNSLVPSAIEFASAATGATESAGSVWIGLVRDTTNAAASVRVTASNGTAAAGSDYQALSTRVEFAAGAATAAVELVLLDDALHEPDESLTLDLSEPGGAGVLGTQRSSVFTILDNDEFLPDRTLTVVSAHGSCEPAAGSHVYPNGTEVSCVATGLLTAGTTQRVCAGWSGTGVVPAAGGGTEIPVFALTADSSVEWHWETNVWLALSADPGGSVSGGETGWVPLGTNLLLTAAAEEGHAFSGWSGEVPAGQEQSNPLAVAADQSRTIHAGFSVEAGVNLLRNPGFEEAGAGSGAAAYWAAGDPDGHGETWGSAIRINWDSHEGEWVQALRGTWAGEGDAAGFWQESAVLPGEAYRFTAWFWADDGNPYGPWNASARALKLEFLDGETGGETLLLAVTNSLAELDQTWRSHSVEAVAPSNAAWVRVVILAEGMSADGSLRVDDLTLEWLSELDAPVALPATDEAGDSFTANWQAVAEAAGYLLDVAGSADFAGDTYAGDLFISEYAEGSGFDRYVEIYNGTGAAVDLSAYRLGMIDNGGAWYEREMVLTGTLAHAETHVIRHPEASNAWILAAADQTAPANGPLDFAGDDAVGLARVTGSFANLLDAVGEEGEDPGAGWGVAGVADATRNHTLIRLASVRSGNPDWTVCSNEWAVLPDNTFTNAGEHVMEGGAPGTFVPGYRDRPCAGVSQAVTGLVAGTTYYYRVRATNDSAVSGYSSVVEVPTHVRHDVVAVAEGRGAIAPSGTVSVVAGTTREFAVQADEFHHIESVRSDGAAVPVTNAARMTVVWGPAAATGLVSAVFAETRTLQDTPHWWLDAWYPGQTNFDDLAAGDEDHDGHQAWQEYVADTDPTDSGDGLRVVPDEEGSGTAVRFLSSTNRHYTLMSAPELDEGTWSPVPGAGPRRGIGGLDRLADSNVPPRGWIYTIQVDLP